VDEAPIIVHGPVRQRIVDAIANSREARTRLKPRGMPYYRSLDKKLHLGYRRIKANAGTWWARHYKGGQEYDVEAIGTADDLSPADGIKILDFWQAQAKARELMQRRAHAVAGKAGPLTVKDVVEDYLSFLETNRKSGRDAQYRAAAFIYPELGGIKVEELTTERLEKWHARLAKTAARLRTTKEDQEAGKQKHRQTADDEEAIRRRRSSANRILTILKAALNRAWRRGKITSDNAWRRVEPFENVEAARVRYLTIAEANRLTNACDAEFRSLVKAALQTGARYGELASMQVSDFNAKAGTVAVRQSKTGKPRHIVLTEEGIELFTGLIVGRTGNELLFQKSNGGRWAKSQQNRPMKAACKRAKIVPAISIHGLRHTWASLSVMAGVPLIVVAKNLGHSDTRMVEKHYGHMAPSYVAEAIRKNAPRFGFKADGKVTAIT
jgi:integrase